MRADVGVMISASHNPYYDNGIKIFDAHGLKLPDEVEETLEGMILEPEKIPTMTNGDLGKAQRLREVFGRYLVHCKAALDERFDMEGMRIVLDCANGAGYKVTPMMFRELGAEVFTIGCEPNGTNINDKCGSLHPDKASEMVNQVRADMGVCLDGDADRCLIIDEKGKVVPGDVLIGLFAKLLLDEGILKKGDTVVGTIMTNLGLENYLKDLGLKLHRTKVGDRYIIEFMEKEGCVLGGEPSGHVIFRQNATTGDGALAGLKMIECVRFYKKSVSELTAGITLYPNVLENVRVSDKPDLKQNKKIQATLKEVEAELGNKGRVVLRYSGTEPKCRVMVEGEDSALVNKSCQTLVEVVKAELG
jgi:phosphoglucosamine mutase